MRNVRQVISACCVATVVSLGLANAQTRPANATAECKDGSFTDAKTKRGACSGHGGVKTWFADSAAKKDNKAVGKETKQAAKDTGAATKSAAKATGEATKEVAKTTGKAAK